VSRPLETYPEATSNLGARSSPRAVFGVHQLQLRSVAPVLYLTAINPGDQAAKVVAGNAVALGTFLYPSAIR